MRGMPPGWETNTDRWPNTADAESRCWLAQLLWKRLRFLPSHGTLVGVGGQLVQKTGRNAKHDTKNPGNGSARAGRSTDRSEHCHFVFGGGGDFIQMSSVRLIRSRQ